jgi:hypothetical protein
VINLVEFEERKQYFARLCDVCLMDGEINGAVGTYTQNNGVVRAVCIVHHAASKHAKFKTTLFCESERIITLPKVTG